MYSLFEILLVFKTNHMTKAVQPVECNTQVKKNIVTPYDVYAYHLQLLPISIITY